MPTSVLGNLAPGDGSDDSADEKVCSRHLQNALLKRSRALYRVTLAEVKSGALNLVQGGERDGTHWIGGTVIKEAGVCSGEDLMNGWAEIK